MLKTAKALLIAGFFVALAGQALSATVPATPLLPAEPAAPPTDIVLTISAAGDVTHGGDRRKGSDLFAAELKRQNGDLAFPFRNVRDLFADDDLTLVNYEGTLTTARAATDNSFSFAGLPEYARALSLGSIEAVALDNNHVFDHGEQGYVDTQQALAAADIVYSGDGTPGIVTAQGVKIGMLSYRTFDGGYARIRERLPIEVAALRAQGCTLVIVSYHWGEERAYVPHDRQIALAHETIDAGVDLVLGHHSHVINPIERYKGKYICYSLANFSFAGNSNPSDKDTFVFQQRFRIVGGTALDAGMRIVPCRVSSVAETNDFAPTPFGPENARRVVEKLIKLGKQIEGGLAEYPLGWE